MKVLLVNGGPHKEGCTHVALSEVAGALKGEGVDSEIIWAGAEPLAGCIACMACRKDGAGRCFRGDVVNDFLDKAADADGFVFGTPVHYAGTCGAINSFMDRAFFAGKGLMAYKPGAAVVSCRRGGASATFDRINKYFTINNMPVVASQYWNSVHGQTPEQVRQDLEGLQIMRTLGRNMAWLLRCIEAGRKAGFDAPKPEEPIVTSYIR